MEAILYFDGGIRKGICAYGWILCKTNKKGAIASGNNTCGFGSSNVAEYRALIAGLQGALKAGTDIIHITGDSQLVVKQVTGAFKTNKPKLIQHRDKVLELLEYFQDFSIKWVPRHLNQRADALVNKAFGRKNL